MNSKTMNIVLMVIIALILVVTVVIAVMTFSNHTPQPLPMHNEENVEANVTVENTIKNEIVEQPENLPTLKNKGEIAKVIRSRAEMPVAANTIVSSSMEWFMMR